MPPLSAAYRGREYHAAESGQPDGFLRDPLRIHVIAPGNCALSQLDPADIRPGRLVGYREFRRRTRKEAVALAGHLVFCVVAGAAGLVSCCFAVVRPALLRIGGTNCTISAPARIGKQSMIARPVRIWWSTTYPASAAKSASRLMMMEAGGRVTSANTQSRLPSLQVATHSGGAVFHGRFFP